MKDWPMFSMFKKVKNKKFDFIPQHYDPAKEDLENRMSKYRDSELTDADIAKARIQEGFKRRSGGGNAEDKKKLSMQSNIRLVMIIGVLILLTYYFLQSDAMTKIFETFE